MDAASIEPPIIAAVASPSDIFVIVTSDSDNPAFSSADSKSIWFIVPMLVAIVLPLRSATLSIPFAATIPSMPAE